MVPGVPCFVPRRGSLIAVLSTFPSPAALPKTWVANRKRTICVVCGFFLMRFEISDISHPDCPRSWVRGLTGWRAMDEVFGVTNFACP